MVFQLRPDVESPEGEESCGSATIKTEQGSFPIPKSRRARRERITRNACRQCRAKKTKCGGQHPVCTRCQTAGISCKYDTSEGVTKMQSLKDQLETRTQEHARDAALLRILVEDSDQAATQLLARLRMNFNDRKTAGRLRRGSDPSPQLQIPPSLEGVPMQYAHSASGSHSATSSMSSSLFNDCMAQSATAASFDMSTYFPLTLPGEHLLGPLMDAPDYSHLMNGVMGPPAWQQAHD